MLQWRNSVYEMFEYIPGQGYPQTLESTHDAGRVLALYHKLLEDFRSEWRPPGGSYHMASAIEQGLRSIAAAMPIGPNNENADVHHLLGQLLKSYRRVAADDCACRLAPREHAVPRQPRGGRDRL